MKAAPRKKAARKRAATPGRTRKARHVSYGTTPAPTLTTAEYAALQTAYDTFNRELFAGTLPQVLITLQRKAGALGYFSPNRFASKNGTLVDVFTDANRAHELALNPDHFGRTELETLSTLAHEMAHVWQETHGTAPRKCYHDREWGKQMKAIGLHPSDTAAPGGKETGQHMSHYIIAGGPFEVAAGRLIAEGFAIRWTSAAADPAAKAKAASKTKFTCPTCEQNAWAKPDAALTCGHCEEPMEANS